MSTPTPTTAAVRAWTYTTGGYPSSLSFSTITPPSVPSPNHILISIQAAALNPVDIQLINLPFWSIPLATFTAPKTVSSDFAGTVLAAAPGTGFNPGDAVFGVTMVPFKPCGGTLSEVAHLNLANTSLAGKPEGWSWHQAAGVGVVWLTARTCVEMVAPFVATTSSKRLVVLGGSSASGMHVIHLAKARGWKVLTSCSGRNADFVTKDMGADEVVDYTVEDVVERVKGFEPDAIVDCVGGTGCLGIARRYVTIVGDKTSRGTMGGSFSYAWNPRMVARWAWGRYGWGERYDCIVLEQKREWLEEAAREVGAEKWIVDSVWPFEDAKGAFERLDTGRARGKVVVEVRK